MGQVYILFLRTFDYLNCCLLLGMVQSNAPLLIVTNLKTFYWCATFTLKRGLTWNVNIRVGPEF